MCGEPKTVSLAVRPDGYQLVLFCSKTMSCKMQLGVPIPKEHIL